VTFLVRCRCLLAFIFIYLLLLFYFKFNPEPSSLFWLGIDRPYGIMSTYDEWRFCWLPRRSTRLATKAEPRDLAGTEVIKWNDPNLPKALVYYLKKMAESTPNAPIAFPTKGEYHLLLTSTKVHWQQLMEPFRTDVFPTTSKKKFFVFAFLGSGAEGTVWKGCDKAGHACAIKVFDKGYTRPEQHQQQPPSDALQMDLAVWNTFGEARVFFVTLTTVPALIMPVLDQPVDWDDQHQQAVRVAIELYSAKYYPRDIKREHVGFYSVNGEPKAVFFDTQPILLHNEFTQALSKQEILTKLGLQ